MVSALGITSSITSGAGYASVMYGFAVCVGNNLYHLVVLPFFIFILCCY